MLRRVALPWLLLAGVLGAVPAMAAGDREVPGLDVARQRMETVRWLSDQLGELAGLQVPPGLSAAERTRAAQFKLWLHNTARKYRQLAQNWETFLARVPRRPLPPERVARMREMSRGFLVRYLDLVSESADEVARFRFTSPAMRQRLDRAIQLIAYLE